MAKCDVCNKGISFGLKVSHSNKKSNRVWRPNVRKVRVSQDGATKSMNVCTRCLRSDKVKKSV